MNIYEKSINNLKSLTAETISNAKSGHTGSALGASSLMMALFHDHFNFDPTHPSWPNRDRLVMSAGHTSAMYYSLLHLFGYDISIDDLKNFRKYGSKTPGHPERNELLNIEVTTGPLGQGIANAVGIAIAQKKLSQTYKSINNKVYCYTGDGCLMEGVAVEACSLAGTLNLNNLILLYDDNNITIDGKKTVSNSEDTPLKFSAMGWNVIEVKNGHNYNDCSKAIAKAKTSKKPTIIIFKTIIGIGTSKQGTPKVHAYPLQAEELAEFKAKLNMCESFYVADDVYAFCKQTTDKNKVVCEKWYNENKDIAKKLEKPSNKTCNFEKLLTKANSLPEQAGRDLSGIILNEVSNYYEFLGGSADVAASTKSAITNSAFLSKNDFSGNNIHFGIREHAMGSICNGIAAASNYKAFDSTFLAFSNYMMPPLKMRAMMKLPVLSIFTHDAINVGEDGPTHQPIEQIGQLRRIVGLDVIRPATHAELVFAYKHYLENKNPVAVLVSKSKLIKTQNTLEEISHGAYVVLDTGKNPEIEIFATGTELALALNVAKELDKSVRIISMPCENLFDSQDKAYKNKVLLKNPTLKVAIEASNDPVWYKYVGENGLIVSVDSYQPSGKGSEVYEKAGFNVKNIVKLIKNKLK